MTISANDLQKPVGRAESWGWPGVDHAGTSTKFVPPPLPRHWIRRDRLARQLSQALERRLTLVTGPPGAGKTVLLADWAHGRPKALLGWLSVEEADNDPICFWTQLAAALGAEQAGEHDWADDRPSSQGARLLNLLSVRPNSDRPQVLVIDDFHLVTEARVLEAVAQLVHDLPPNLRVVLAGQGFPGFSVREFESRGEVTTLGDTDVRFTVEESAALIALAGGKFLAPDDVTALTERNEGWAAGLHLAALGLAHEANTSAFVRRYSGSFGPVAAYLEHEMLLRQPPHVVRFLLQTSVLDDFTADLGHAVGGRPDAGEILDSLADHSLFVIRTDSGEPRYRYHRLVADLLASRLQREDPALSRQAHLRAGTSLERRADFRRAAHHFTQARAYDRALRLVFSNLGHAFPSGDADDLATFEPAEAPGQDCLATDPGHLYVQAATFLQAHRVSDAAQLLTQMSRGATSAEDGARWRRRLDFLWAMYADLTADAPSVENTYRAAPDLLAPPRASAPDSVTAQEVEAPWLPDLDAAIAAHLPILTARAHLRQGRPDLAKATLIDQFETEERAQARHPEILAMVACSQGRLQTAYRLASATLQNCEQHSVASGLVVDARLVLAEVLFEHNELDAAEEQLLAALHLANPDEANHPSWPVDIDFVRVLISKQRLGEALNRIGHLRQAERRNPPAHYILRKLNEVEIGCRIDLDDLDGALRMAQSSPPGDVSTQTLARLDLRSGRADRALRRLGTGPSNAIATEIRRLVLVACAEMQQGRVERATHTLQLAVEKGRTEQYVRPFLEEAAHTLPALRGLAATRPDSYVTLLVSQAEQLVPSAAAVGSTTMIEPLTEREREVLTYLPSHLSRDQIARLMCVSSNTVKTHITAIYRKVGATSRAEAVGVARCRGLLALTATMDRSPWKQ